MGLMSYQAALSREIVLLIGSFKILALRVSVKDELMLRALLLFFVPSPYRGEDNSFDENFSLLSMGLRRRL